MRKLLVRLLLDYWLLDKLQDMRYREPVFISSDLHLGHSSYGDYSSSDDYSSSYDWSSSSDTSSYSEW